MNRTAILFDAASKSLSTTQLPDAPLADGEVQIHVTCCTICGSDLHTFTGRRSAPPRCVLGHEIVGTIDRWGGSDPPQDIRGRKLVAGQRVTWAMAVGCGTCFYCRHGISQKCESLFKYGHETLRQHSTGGLSETCVLVPGTPIMPIPDSLDDTIACPANCATATVSAAMRLTLQTHPIEDATAMVIGAGMLGITAAAQLADRGARKIIVVDRDSNRLQIVGRFGATDTLVPEPSTDIPAAIRQRTEGRGVDIAFDFAGFLPAVENCLQSIRIGGVAILAGSTFPSEPLKISPETILRRMLTIRGLHNYITEDLEDAVNFLERTRQRYPFHELISSPFSLNQIEDAFAYAIDEKPIRVAVRMDGS
ncbi:zinc-binding dehydrogenase [Roseiconus lacunae]|uniref:zinc-binding dehydrogenase n=1 Tax=Roseiconus lacunae TaxID=2605694 RepID=UPI0030859095|nr:zinc-binding dehydrogenase [Stieleria sp. HD01]